MAAPASAWAGSGWALSLDHFHLTGDTTQTEKQTAQAIRKHAQHRQSGPVSPWCNPAQSIPHRSHEFVGSQSSPERSAPATGKSRRRRGLGWAGGAAHAEPGRCAPSPWWREAFEVLTCGPGAPHGGSAAPAFNGSCTSSLTQRGTDPNLASASLALSHRAGEEQPWSSPWHQVLPARGSWAEIRRSP